MSVNRRALVVKSGNALDIMTRESLGVRPSVLGTPSAIARPGIGGNQDGWQYQPAPNTDEVMVLAEVGDHMSTVVSAFDPTKLGSMAPQSSALWSKGTPLIVGRSGTATYQNATFLNQTIFEGTIAQATTNPTWSITAAGAAAFASATVTGTTVLEGTVAQAASTPTWNITATGDIAAQGTLTLSQGGAAPSVATVLTGGSVALIEGNDQCGLVSLTCTNTSAALGLQIFTLTYASPKTTTKQPHVFTSIDFVGRIYLNPASQLVVQANGSAGNWTGFSVWFTQNISTFSGLDLHYLVVL